MKFNKKQVISICLIILGIVITMIIIMFIEKNNKNEAVEVNANINYDEATKLYYIKNETTGEIISASQNEDDLEFYKDNPDYNPNPLQEKTNNLEEYANMYFYN